ncbi:MAG: FkbM family methyltransferase [Pirellulales bacterium]|nr:FkbM family methyltransferase [Pirellulales bacterium]
MARFLRNLQHMALKRFPTLAWKVWHLKDGLRQDHEFEVEFITRIDSLIDCQNRTAIDIGANFGVYTRILCKLFQTTHSVEPLPNLAIPLKKAGPKNCVVHQLALGTEHGELELSVPYSETKGEIFALTTAQPDRLDSAVADDILHVKKVKTKVAPFDEVFRDVDDIDFIKIDVEGSEMNVLQGGRETLQRQMPVVLIEAEKHCGEDGLRIFDFLEELGYGVYHYRNGRLTRTDRSILDEMEKYLDAQPESQRQRRYRDQNYIYNFIFCCPEKVKRPGS